MNIGVPKEIKNHEYRVGLVPSSVHELINAGHQVYIESSAGIGCGFTDQDYLSVGATILPSAENIFEQAELLIKVKEPQPIERQRLTHQHILFTYLHLAPDWPQTQDLIASKATCIAYETITSPSGGLPLLAPMSEVAGRMAIQAGAQALEKSNQGAGVLLGGVPGVPAANVVIIGGGMVGCSAAKMAIGLGANVTILDKNIEILRGLDTQYGNKIKTLFSNRDTLEKACLHADLIIGAVLVPGAEAPKLVSEEMVQAMKDGAAIVDVAIDQGGCIATSHPTTHQNPIFIKHGVVHYCVANMPGAVARTSTFALNNATLPYILQLANNGYKNAMLADEHLLAGLNIYNGKITNKAVASAHNLPYSNSKELL